MKGTRDAWDPVALRFGLGFPVILAVAFLIAGFVFRNEVPHGVALAGIGNPVPYVVYLAVAAGSIVLVGVLIALQAARRAVSPLLRRILLGFAVTSTLVLASLFAAGILAQAGTSTPAPGIDPIVFASGSGAAVAMGFVIAFTFRPDEQWNERDDQALAAELDPELLRDSLNYWIKPRASVIVMILLVGVLPGALLLPFVPWLSAVLVLLAVLAIGALSGLLDADRFTATVRLAGVFPVLSVDLAHLQGAVAAVVEAKLYGGWGIRRQGTKASFLAGSGPAVVVRMDDGGAYVIGAPNEARAQELADLLNRRSGAIGQANL